MHSELRAQVAFRLTGLRSDATSPPDPRALRPALAAHVRDLASLRYDFPVVLVKDPRDEAFARPLSEVIDELLAAPTPDGGNAQPRSALLRLEREIRTVLSEGTSGSLSQLWDVAAARVAGTIGADAVGELARVRKALKVDGALADCDAAFPRRYVLHAWEILQKRKAARFHAEAQRLILALGDIIAAEDSRSPHGRSAARLRESFGTVHRDSFDFDAMSRLLQRAPARRALTDARRRRIRSLIATLESQRFFVEQGGHAFQFDRCADVLKSFHARYAGLRSLARALALARLEAAGEYDEVRHAPLFRHMRGSVLTRAELASFPDYAVCVRESGLNPVERAEVLELLACGIPVKILLQSDDLLGESAASEGLAAIGGRMRALTGAAVGLADVFVVQAAASHLPRMRREVLEALSCPGAALVSVYSGAVSAATALPPYLNAAAACESRAFPSFTYDPRKAAYSIEHNPQPDRDWPLHAFDYEDREHQRAHRDLAFTSADFTAFDPRFARHFQTLRGAAQGLPVADCLDGDTPDDSSPMVAMVSDADLLCDLAVDEAVLIQARRCRDAWRSLQLLARAQAPAAKQAPAAAPAADAPSAPVASPSVAAPAAAPESGAAPSSDEAYIETPRCTTCNECTTINNKMFAYDANKQAFIADANAGTYRQLVEAAESCQVSIIHPGRPRNRDEAGVDELLERAAAFP